MRSRSQPPRNGSDWLLQKALKKPTVKPRVQRKKFMTIQSAASAIERYVKHRIPPGDFLTAVLENKLAESIFRADKESLYNLEGIVRHCWSNLPASVWGSPETVQRHLSRQIDVVIDGIDIAEMPTGKATATPQK